MIRCRFHLGEAVRRKSYHSRRSCGVISLRRRVECGLSFLFRGKKSISAPLPYISPSSPQAARLLLKGAVSRRLTEDCVSPSETCGANHVLQFPYKDGHRPPLQNIPQFWFTSYVLLRKTQSSAPVCELGHLLSKGGFSLRRDGEANRGGRNRPPHR